MTKDKTQAEDKSPPADNMQEIADKIFKPAMDRLASFEEAAKTVKAAQPSRINFNDFAIGAARGLVEASRAFYALDRNVTPYNEVHEQKSLKEVLESCHSVDIAKLLLQAVEELKASREEIGKLRQAADPLRGRAMSCIDRQARKNGETCDDPKCQNWECATDQRDAAVGRLQFATAGNNILMAVYNAAKNVKHGCECNNKSRNFCTRCSAAIRLEAAVSAADATFGHNGKLR